MATDTKETERHSIVSDWCGWTDELLHRTHTDPHIPSEQRTSLSMEKQLKRLFMLTIRVRAYIKVPRNKRILHLPADWRLFFCILTIILRSLSMVILCIVFIDGKDFLPLSLSATLIMNIMTMILWKKRSKQKTWYSLYSLSRQLSWKSIIHQDIRVRSAPPPVLRESKMPG